MSLYEDMVKVASAYVELTEGLFGKYMCVNLSKYTVLSEFKDMNTVHIVLNTEHVLLAQQDVWITFLPQLSAFMVAVTPCFPHCKMRFLKTYLFIYKGSEGSIIYLWNIYNCSSEPNLNNE